jgi:hypothetical protein
MCKQALVRLGHNCIFNSIPKLMIDNHRQLADWLP